MSFLHDLVKSLGGDERRKKASAAVSKPSPLKLSGGAAPSTGTELVAASDESGGTGGAGAPEDGSRKRESTEGWASNEALQARYGQIDVHSM